MVRAAVKPQRREQILDALNEVIAGRGTAGASVSEIAQRAGIARGALHYFFASKEEIVEALMRRLGTSYLHALQSHLNVLSAQGARHVTAELARWHFRGDPHATAHKMTVWIDFWGQAATNPVLGGIVADVQQGARGVFATAMLADRPQLAVLPDDTLQAHAAAVLALVEGTLLQWRFGANTHPALVRDAMAQRVFFAVDALVVASSQDFSFDDVKPARRAHLSPTAVA